MSRVGVAGAPDAATRSRFPVPCPRVRAARRRPSRSGFVSEPPCPTRPRPPVVCCGL